MGELGSASSKFFFDLDILYSHMMPARIIKQAVHVYSKKAQSKKQACNVSR